MVVEQEGALRVGRIVARLARHEEVALSHVDLSPAQYRVLGFLDGGPSNARALANKLAVAPPSLTTVVDGLVARGLVERRHDTEDRRRIALRLTDDGRGVLERADEIVEKRLDEVLAHVTPAAGQRALRALEAWQVPLDRYRAARTSSR